MSIKLHPVGRRGHTKRQSRRRLRIEALEPRNLLAGLSMSDEEQLVIELINRAREAPAAEAARLGVGLNSGLPAGTITSAPKPPLAPQQVLINVAVAHTQDMLRRNFFSHTNPDGKNTGDRLNAAGYPWIALGENIAWGTNLNAEGFHNLLFRSAGHRKNILAEKFREIGVGIRRGSVLKGTEVFGNTWGDAYITGVAFTDRVVKDNFFSIGEGSGNLTITATPASGGSAHTTITGSTGGYSLRVPSGTYTVTADRADLAAPIVVSGVLITSDNAKVDFVVSPGSIDPDRYESNNAFSSAADLDTDDQSILHLSIHETSDQDYFRWQSPGTGQLTVQLDLQRRDRNLDLVLYDASHNQIASSTGTSSIETATSAVTAGATYFIRVLGVGGATHADYDLLIDGPAPIGTPPVAEPDRNMTEKAQVTSLDVLANDSDDVGLDSSTVLIVALPEHGQVSVHETTGIVTYAPNSDSVGVDKFTYTVQDEEGLVSNEAQVEITVLDLLNGPWQNPKNPFDINCNGAVSAEDALILINEINEGQARSLPVPSPLGDFPPMYLDTTGEGDLTARDVLRVINFINGNPNGAGEGEPGSGEPFDTDYPLISSRDEAFVRGGSARLSGLPLAPRVAERAANQIGVATAPAFLRDATAPLWNGHQMPTDQSLQRIASILCDGYWTMQERVPAIGTLSLLPTRELEQTLDLLVPVFHAASGGVE